MSALRLRLYREQVTELRSGFLGEVRVPVGLGDWRWSLTASNGRRVGASSEAYRKRIDAVKNAALVLDITVGALRRSVAGASPGQVTSIYRGGATWDVPIRIEVQP